MNCNRKDTCTKMLRSQQISGTKLFDLSWKQASLLLDCKNQKINQGGGNNNGGKKQDGKNQDETDSSFSTNLVTSGRKYSCFRLLP